MLLTMLRLRIVRILSFFFLSFFFFETRFPDTGNRYGRDWVDERGLRKWSPGLELQDHVKSHSLRNQRAVMELQLNYKVELLSSPV